MLVATTAATTRQVKNMHPASARALAVLESPNRRGWGLLERFSVKAVLARGAACELMSCVLTIVAFEHVAFSSAGSVKKTVGYMSGAILTPADTTTSSSVAVGG